jgi:hypothetical protein
MIGGGTTEEGTSSEVTGVSPREGGTGTVSMTTRITISSIVEKGLSMVGVEGIMTSFRGGNT